MGFICGYNMPGYLPDSDEAPHVFDTFDEAKRALIEDIDRHADNSDEVSDHNLANALAFAMEDINLWSGPDSVHICNPDRKHDLGTVYWIYAYPELED